MAEEEKGGSAKGGEAEEAEEHPRAARRTEARVPEEEADGDGEAGAGEDEGRGRFCGVDGSVGDLEP